MKENLVTKDNILSEAIYRCFKEMYAHAQPPVDYDYLLELHKAGKEDKKDPFYQHYYLSQEECKYIMEKYVHAYRLEDMFPTHVECIERYFNEPVIDKYIKDDGDKPGYRGYEHLKSLRELIGDEHADIVFDYLNKAKNFYRFNRDENSFNWNVALGCSPTSNKETVIEFWKKQGVDLNIVDRSDNEIFYRHYEGITSFTEDDGWDDEDKVNYKSVLTQEEEEWLQKEIENNTRDGQRAETFRTYGIKAVRAMDEFYNKTGDLKTW